MAHKCFISFKMEDEYYKKKIQEECVEEIIDKSLKKPIDSKNEDYIMKEIRSKHLTDSTVTIFLIGKESSEKAINNDKIYIKRELQASLYNGEANNRNGIVGVVLPNMYEPIYKGKKQCIKCGLTHNYININDSTVIKEFSYNYYIPKNNDKCGWSEEERYCVLVKWDDFIKNPDEYINLAFSKRESKISEKIKVYPK